MHLRLILLVVLAASAAIAVISIIINVITNMRQRKIAQAAIQRANEDEQQLWSDTVLVQDLISLYIKMVLKHGPNS